MRQQHLRAADAVLARSCSRRLCARPIWPTAAAACSSCDLRAAASSSRAASCLRRSRRERPSRLRCPARAAPRSARHQPPMAASSSPRPSLVTRLEPTFTTRRFEAAMTERIVRSLLGLATPARGRAQLRDYSSSLHGSGAAAGSSRNRTSAARSSASAARDASEFFDDVLVDRVGSGSQPSPRERRDLEHRALPLEALDEVLDARLALVVRHHVELVQHEPARLFVQRCVVLPQFVDDRLALPRPDRRLRRTAPGRRGAAAGAVRCRWRRNWWPRPAPSAAPSIRPGMSATTKLCSGPTRTTPRFGAAS